MSLVRTTVLLGLLTGILLAIGFFFAGIGGMAIALLLAIIINFLTYWYSDKIVLKIYKAKPTDNKKLHRIVNNLIRKADIPKPGLYIVKSDIANAFATGRNPKNSAIAVTNGLLDNLTYEEIEGVLAHEISHIKNRDTLVSTLAATIGGAIAFLARIAWYSAFGQRDRGAMVLLPFVILAPIAALLIQLAITRGREFGADYTGAMISKKPEFLASALEKIAKIAKQKPVRGVNPATSHMWIVNPFKADALTNLFSTHPSTESRISRLRELAKTMKA